MVDSSPSNLSALAEADGADLAGIIIVERDLQGDSCIAWSFPNPGEAVEAAVLAQTEFPAATVSGMSVSLAQIDGQWVYT